MNARIIKGITLSDGTVLNRGDIVDVSGWRNKDTLARIRYIEFITEDDAPVTPAPAKPKAPAKKPAAKPRAKRVTTEQ
jgi:hypothetical protein